MEGLHLDARMWGGGVYAAFSTHCFNTHPVIARKGLAQVGTGSRDAYIVPT